MDDTQGQVQDPQDPNAGVAGVTEDSQVGTGDAGVTGGVEDTGATVDTGATEPEVPVEENAQ